MSAMTNAQRRAAVARSRKNPAKNKSKLMFAAITVAAMTIVGGLIAAQVLGGGGSSIPARVAIGDGRVLGDANAPVTVVEYADFQCPVCKRAETSIISEIERDYITQGLVKVEFRMYPFLGQESWDAAQAAEAAREQGKFWEYHDALFNAQGRENSGAFSYDKLVEIAQAVGLDVPQFEATLTSNKYLDPIQKEVDGARGKDVASTPTFFIGETKIVGAQDYETFQQAIEAGLANANAGAAQ